MKWQTKVETGISPDKISYDSKIIFIGSCFAQEIGEIMSRVGFDVNVNPFGVLYNPASIASSLDKLATPLVYTKDDIIANGDIYKSLAHSSEYSDMTEEGLLNRINESLKDSSRFFAGSEWVVVTLGTSWVYKLKNNGRVVANCHKLHSDNFVRESMSVNEIVNLMAPHIEKTPQKRWVFNISPIRHLKDGAHGNQLSKATLILAIEELVKRYPNSIYFPSYEIVMDELRDYRFYAGDMIHLSKEAIEYVWERFAEFVFSPETFELLKYYKRLVLMKEHRPMFPKSEEFAAFEKKKEELEGYITKKTGKTL